MNISDKDYYFSLQASWGMTKHMGGIKATRELIRMCHIAKDSYVLDVGSGVGITACRLAGEYGVRVVGLDLSEDMVKKANERARKKKVDDKVKFVVGAAQNIPFNDSVFDAVISESVVVFAEEKRKALEEYKRVIKSGGYVGLNEVTWLEPPPEKLAEYLSGVLGGAVFLPPASWAKLLKETGLIDMKINVYKTTAVKQWIDEINQMDMGDISGAWYKFVLQLFKNKGLRKWAKNLIWSMPPAIFNIFRYFGYGIYVGRKNKPEPV